MVKNERSLEGSNARRRKRQEIKAPVNQSQTSGKFGSTGIDAVHGPDSTALALLTSTMASKRRWDQQGNNEEGESTAGPSQSRAEDNSKSASEAAAAAAAIAAKIAAQFASGGFDLGKEEAEFTHDIDINDVRNRYLLTKGSTQEQVRSNFDSGSCTALTRPNL